MSGEVHISTNVHDRDTGRQPHVHQLDQHDGAGGHGHGHGSVKAAASVFSLICGLFIWYGSASISAIASSAVLTRLFPTFVWIDVSVVLVATGSLPLLWLFVTRPSARARISQSLSDKTMRRAAFFHTVGTLATCASFATVSASLTQVVKALEPVFTMILAYILHRSAVPPMQTLAAMLISLGIAVACAGDGTAISTGVMAAVVSALCFPARNVLSAGVRTQLSPTEKYAAISALSFGWSLAPLAFKLIFFNSIFLGGIRDRLTTIFVAAISHISYNSASYFLLDHTSPITHSIANICKRFSTVISSHIYFLLPYTGIEAVGLAITAAGFALYTAVKFGLGRRSLADSVKSSRWGLVKAIAACFVGALILSALVRNSGTLLPGSSVEQSSSKPYERKAEAPRLGLILWPEAGSPFSETDSPLEAHISLFDEVIVMCALRDSCQRSLLSTGLSQDTRLRIRIDALVGVTMCEGTALENWFEQHVLNKLIVGEAYPVHVMTAVRLCAVHRFGGSIIDPHSAANPCAAVHPPWSVCVGLNSKAAVLDVRVLAAGSPNSPQVLAMIDAFVKAFPVIRSVTAWPHDVRYGKALATAFMDACSPSRRKSNDTSADLLQFEGIQKGLSSCVVVKVPPIETTLASGRAFVVLSGAPSSSNPAVNLGDTIQTLPGLQFLPYVTGFIERDLHASGDGKWRDRGATMLTDVKWGVSVDTWPPPPSIQPIPISIYVDRPPFDKLLSTRDSLAWFRAHTPIGAGNSQTLQYLLSLGIPAYFSGSATMLLGTSRRRNPPARDVIYIVDVGHRIVNMLPIEIVEKAVILSHEVRINTTVHVASDKLASFVEAFDRIQRYQRARLVITQSMDAALSCVAMETPVIYINDLSPTDGVSNGRNSTSPETFANQLSIFHSLDLTDDAHTFFSTFNYNNPPPNPNVGQRDRQRAVLWNSIRSDEDLRAAGMFNGVVPLRRLPSHQDSVDDSRTFFHIVRAPFGAHARSWGVVQQRALESIFFHHPDVRVVIHVLGDVLQSSVFSSLAEVGYNITIRSVDVAALMAQASSQGVEMSQRFADSLRAPSDFSQHAQSYAALRLLIAFSESGVHVDSGVIFTKRIGRLRYLQSSVFKSESHAGLNGALFVVDRPGSPLAREGLAVFSAANMNSNLFTGGMSDVLSHVLEQRGSFGAGMYVTPALALRAFDLRRKEDACYEKRDSTSFMRFVAATGREMPMAVVLHGVTEVLPSSMHGTLCEHLLTRFCIMCNEQPLRPLKF